MDTNTLDEFQIKDGDEDVWEDALKKKGHL